MAESFSIERRKLMRFLGAKVILTPAAMRGTGMVAKAVELAAAHGWFYTRQFENEANPDMHSRTTAREIIDDFRDDGLDYWVTGYGTGGTLKGVGRVLAKESPKTKIVVCEPAAHPAWTPHPMQGWTPDFIPKLTDDAVAMGFIERIVTVSGPDALYWSQELAKQEGLFVGITSGGTFAGAVKVAQDAPTGANILCMLPDTAERYLSTPLFENVPVDMTEEEQAIWRSTPLGLTAA
jgi:cysteine synthase A